MVKSATLIFTEDFPYWDGGRTIYAYQLAKIFYKYDKKILVLTHLFSKQDLDFDRRLPFKVIRVTMYKNRWLRFIRMALIFLKLCICYNIKKVYAVVWFKPGFITYLLGRFFGIEYFLTVFAYEVTAYKKPSFRKYIMNLTFKKAKLIFTCSQFTKDVIMQIMNLDPEKIINIPLGVGIETFKPNLDSSVIKNRFNLYDKKVILTVGRLVDYKGQDMVIKAMPKILKVIPNAIYIIVGRDCGAESMLRKLVFDLNLENYVIFAGYVRHPFGINDVNSELSLYYNACDLFVMLSREDPLTGDAEGFGLVYLEASACGKAVIGGRSGGVPSAVLDGVTGLLADPLDIDDIAEKIISLLTDKNYAGRLANEGLRRTQQLSWENIILKTLNASQSKKNN